MPFELNQKLTLKKPHACGGNEFEVVRTGADIKLKCLKCGHIIMLDAPKLKGRVIRSENR